MVMRVDMAEVLAMHRSYRVLQQLRQDQAGALAGSRSPFSSMDDAVHRLLPYHVFQGALPSDSDFHRGNIP